MAIILWTALAAYFVISTSQNPYSHELCVRGQVTDCRNFLLPAEVTAYQKVSSGAWSTDHALDYLVSQNASPIPIRTTLIIWAIGLAIITAVWYVARRRRGPVIASSSTSDDRPFLERLPTPIRQPSVIGLVIAWVVAVCTVVVYPVAIYMSWRYYAGWRDAGSKVCPRCAERVKAAALVCRHCGYELQAGAPHTESPTLA